MSVSARKLIKVGSSHAVVLPPHVLDHIHAEVGDFLAIDISSKNFAIISLAPIPPIIKTSLVVQPETVGDSDQTVLD